MTAPACPISSSQIPSNRRAYADAQPRPITMPVIPPANDLPSLIRTVNLTRDVLRQLTSNLTVNNLYLPKTPFFKSEGDTHYSLYPQWEMSGVETSQGYVYHHEKDGSLDKDQRVSVRRQNRVSFTNNTQADPDFVWAYSKPLDSLGVEPLFPTG
jgi:hypothetical protein